MPFPAESVPDGAFFAPHHFLYSLYAVVVVYVLKLHGDQESEPALILVSAAVALFGWFHFWPYYPATGAVVSLVGTLGVIAGGIVHVDVPTRWRAAVVALGLFALEDWIDHALEVDTPASIVFDQYVYHLLP